MGSHFSIPSMRPKNPRHRGVKTPVWAAVAANCRCWVRGGGAYRSACFSKCLTNARRDNITCVHNNATITSVSVTSVSVTSVSVTSVSSASKATACIPVPPELLGCLRTNRQRR
jgi:hypothetical protein